MARIIRVNVKGGSVLRILQLARNGDAFFLDFFKDGLGEVIHSAGVNSLDFGLAVSFVALQPMGFWKRGMASLTSKASTVFGQVLDITEVTVLQVESEGGLALSFR